MDAARPAPVIALVAGEASGDLLGADLIRALRQRYPQARFVGVGGPQMRAEGFESWWDCSELAVMGLTEVLRHLPRLLRLRHQLRARLLRLRPDVFVGIDAPDFNLGLERRLKQAGLRTVHYVSPSVWAWRRERAAKLGHSADRVLCLFPMEPPIYAEYGVDARFIGHPLAEQYPLPHDRAAARAALGIAADARLLALLPGSRLGEIGRIGADFIATAARLQATRPHLQIIAPMANAACRAAFEAQLASASASPRIRLLDGQSSLALRAADVVLLASGTAALEALLAGTPMVVGYRISALTHWIVRSFGLLKVSHFSLPNALAGGALVPECMQDDCRPEVLERALAPLLDSPAAAAAQTEAFARLHAELKQGASASAATAIAELIDAH
ncbi:lipid-A-disaccharide synthase [Aquimonas voraii]|uniref:Lipid-A-disaccharide synthase n=1 Tax=Aquimonas voraii TaxID=265719 RepID=A0A1G6S4N8_9GAMM|nr:lipid-A-disaccharide synthase [Aquimonas voraii]SDD11828.1 lipid-A-disaccharide synthase [Aquimonas voraii]